MKLKFGNALARKRVTDNDIVRRQIDRLKQTTTITETGTNRSIQTDKQADRRKERGTPDKYRLHS